MLRHRVRVKFHVERAGVVLDLGRDGSGGQGDENTDGSHVDGCFCGDDDCTGDEILKARREDATNTKRGSGRWVGSKNS